MTERRARRALALGTLFAALGAAQPAEAQVIVELGPQVSAVAADPASVIGGGYAALRTLGRTRFALMAGVGTAEGGATAWRGELTGHFLLSPRALRGLGAYVGGGAAATDAGDGASGRLVLLVGIETAPARSGSWSLEAALGGGLRVSAGWRWRIAPPNWRFRGGG
jgi:hypothetical protein